MQPFLCRRLLHVPRRGLCSSSSSSTTSTDFSAVYSLATLERTLPFNMLSWDNMLGPAYHFDTDVAKRVAVAVAEASCTTCKQVPVMRMVNTLNACESGVTLHDLALQVCVFLVVSIGIS